MATYKDLPLEIVGEILQYLKPTEVSKLWLSGKYFYRSINELLDLSSSLAFTHFASHKEETSSTSMDWPVKEMHGSYYAAALVLHDFSANSIKMIFGDQSFKFTADNEQITSRKFIDFVDTRLMPALVPALDRIELPTEIDSSDLCAVLGAVGNPDAISKCVPWDSDTFEMSWKVLFDFAGAVAGGRLAMDTPTRIENYKETLAFAAPHVYSNFSNKEFGIIASFKDVALLTQILDLFAQYEERKPEAWKLALLATAATVGPNSLSCFESILAVCRVDQYIPEDFNELLKSNAKGGSEEILAVIKQQPEFSSIAAKELTEATKLAASMNHMKWVEMMIDVKGVDNYAILRECVEAEVSSSEQSNSDIVEKLLQKLVDHNASYDDAAVKAVVVDSPDWAYWTGSTPRLDIVKLLTSRGAVDSPGTFTEFLDASCSSRKGGHVECLNYVLDLPKVQPFITRLTEIMDLTEYFESASNLGRWDVVDAIWDKLKIEIDGHYMIKFVKNIVKDNKLDVLQSLFEKGLIPTLSSNGSDTVTEDDEAKIDRAVDIFLVTHKNTKMCQEVLTRMEPILKDAAALNRVLKKMSRDYEGRKEAFEIMLAFGDLANRIAGSTLLIDAFKANDFRLQKLILYSDLVGEKMFERDMDKCLEAAETDISIRTLLEFSEQLIKKFGGDAADVPSDNNNNTNRLTTNAKMVEENENENVEGTASR